MHIPDWDPEFLSKLEPKEYAELMEQGGATNAMVYANSHVGLCYYPTKVGRMHKGLGGKDFFGQVVELCHKRSISVVAYYTLVFNNYAYIKHPNWRATANGWYPPTGPNSNNRYGTCCPNSPYREFALAETEEICTNYDVEGIFFDMTFWPGVCLCSHCQARYKKEFGKDIPEIINWNDTEWLQFQRVREQWIKEFASVMTKKVREINPRMTVTHQFSTVLADWRFGVPYSIADHCDYLAGDFYGDAAQQSVVCKAFQSLSAKKPFEFHTSRCLDLTDHVTMKSKGRMETQAFVAPAHSSAFLFIDAINPDGSFNYGTYEYTKSIFEKMAPYEKELGGRLCADVALYLSHESKFNPSDNGISIKNLNHGINDMPHVSALMGAARGLLEAHIPYAVVTKRNLSDLSKYQVLILSDVLMMSEDEIKAVREFVKRGGCLYASYRTSMGCNETGPATNFMLSDIFGVSFEKAGDSDLTFFTPADERFKKLIWPQDHVIHPGKQIVIKECKGEIFATRTLPRTEPLGGEMFGDTFSSIHSNPPASISTGPAIVFNKFGKGQVIYITGALEAIPHDVNKKVFSSLVKILLRKPIWFSASAHKSLEFVLFNQPKDKRLLLSIFQTNPELIDVPLNTEFRVKVPEGFSPVRIERLPEGESVKYSVADNCIQTKAEIDTFGMFAIYYV